VLAVDFGSWAYVFGDRSACNLAQASDWNSADRRMIFVSPFTRR
jgi:hypothetical protein